MKIKREIKAKHLSGFEPTTSRSQGVRATLPEPLPRSTKHELSAVRIAELSFLPKLYALKVC